jgi:N-acyl-D-amino-acid deacylase
MLDLIIRGGLVLDGSAQPGNVADVGVVADRIVSVGSLRHVQALQEIDATGLVVAPGFIDIHTHSDFVLLVDGRADSQLCQGVTTEIIGQCGFSCAPIGASGLTAQIGGSPEENVNIDWRSFGQYRRFCWARCDPLGDQNRRNREHFGTRAARDAGLT